MRHNQPHVPFQRSYEERWERKIILRQKTL